MIGRPGGIRKVEGVEGASPPRVEEAQLPAGIPPHHLVLVRTAPRHAHYSRAIP